MISINGLYTENTGTVLDLSPAGIKKFLQLDKQKYYQTAKW